jgi:hypothetical protein
MIGPKSREQVNFDDWLNAREMSPAVMTLIQLEAALGGYNHTHRSNSHKMYKGDVPLLGAFLIAARFKMMTVTHKTV